MVRENPLGQWIASTLAPRFGRTAEVRSIERVLQLMLRYGQELVTMYQRGQIEDARAGLEQIDAYAAEIDAWLQHLEHRPAA
ncbi:hypothetical protein [Hymenobacter sp. B81]|uniref:hypothetical protein n=1 Tax=Hymenobacter sp. B81 TaxID=3344878 RepID=UPI0037DC0A71